MTLYHLIHLFAFFLPSLPCTHTIFQTSKYNTKKNISDPQNSAKTAKIRQKTTYHSPKWHFTTSYHPSFQAVKPRFQATKPRFQAIKQSFKLSSYNFKPSSQDSSYKATTSIHQAKPTHLFAYSKHKNIMQKKHIIPPKQRKNSQNQAKNDIS